MNPKKPESAENAGIAVELRRVTKHYFGPLGGFLGTALTGVSFDVRIGEIFGLVGPSGSGKSVAAKVMAGQMKPMEGKVRVFGRSPRRHSIKKRIVYLPQSKSNPPNAVPDITLIEALMKRADLLILDGLFCGLDLVAHQEMKTFILDQARRGKTVILTSQSLLEVNEICSRIALFYGGRVEAVGTLNQLLASAHILRSVAPVLSPSLSEQMLQILRNDLSKESAKNTPVARPSAKIAAAENNMLNPLTNPPTTEPGQFASPPIADPIDHERLAQLTRPHPAAPSRFAG